MLPHTLIGTTAKLLATACTQVTVARHLSPTRAQWLARLLACITAAGVLTSHGAEDQYAPIAPRAVTSTLIDIDRAGGRLIAVGERGHVLYSDDKGESWLQARMPFRRMLTGVHFVGPQQGWAVGHQSMIFHTQDGGENWAQQVDGFNFQQRFNLDNLARTREAYVALSAELDATPDPDREMELEDALFAFEDAELALEEPPIPTNFHDVWFLNKNSGWAVGAFGRLVETRDGGNTWTDKSHLVQTPDGLHLNAITGTAHGEIYIAGEGGVMFRSVDAGANWEQMDVGYDGTFFGVVHDQVNGVLRVFGLGSALYQSRDKGINWEGMDNPVSATFAGGTATPKGDTILVGPGGMVTLIDGATEFIKAHPQPGRRNYSSAVVLGAGEMVLVGQGGPQRISLE